MTDIDSEEWRLRERASLFDLCRQMLLFRLSLCLMMLATRATSHLLGDTCTIAGNGATGYADGAAGAASFSGPSGISTWANGNSILVVDTGNNVVRLLASAQVSTIAGNGRQGVADGQATSAEFNSPSDVATKTDFNTGMVTALVSDTNNKKIRFLYVGQEQVGSFVQTSMQQPSALALAPNQATLIVSDLELHQLLTFNMADGKTSKFVGNGQRGYQDGATASFNGPRGLTFSPDGTYVCSPALTPMTSTCCRFLWLTQATMS
uniref:SMP-30/Gluconolactonase/LRE-like region domain-containing protein n=1 Tax=Guillardia theta TaxID=55529 RepID=A0A7S4H829_GUITH|mmetsp:Transcript_10111/g.33679  ORF Transcript_10111/g.33679 Transcript_10111/m.33679 type:complete len:264 (+) Transcript_10111:392-1183(+)